MPSLDKCRRSRKDHLTNVSNALAVYEDLAALDPARNLSALRGDADYVAVLGEYAVSSSGMPTSPARFWCLTR